MRAMPVAVDASSRRMRSPVAATCAGRRSIASGSSAAAAASTAWARATNGALDRSGEEIRGTAASGCAASSRPDQMSAATSSSDRDRASSVASMPR
jgi:hypothetical protein